MCLKFYKIKALKDGLRHMNIEVWDWNTQMEICTVYMPHVYYSTAELPLKLLLCPYFSLSFVRELNTEEVVIAN